MSAAREHMGGTVWVVLDSFGDPLWHTVAERQRDAKRTAATFANAPWSALRAGGLQCVRLDYRYTCDVPK